MDELLYIGNSKIALAKIFSGVYNKHTFYEHISGKKTMYKNLVFLPLVGLSILLSACSHQETEQEKYYRQMNEERQKAEKQRLITRCGFQEDAHRRLPNDFQISPECKKILEEVEKEERARARISRGG